MDKTSVYITAILSCFFIFVLYVLCFAFVIRGIIPTAIFLFAIISTWKGITGSIKKEDNEEQKAIGASNIEEIKQYDTVHDENGKEWTVSSVEETEVHLTDGQGNNISMSPQEFAERRRAERSTAEESGGAKTLGTEGTLEALEAEMPTIMQEEQQVAGLQQTGDNYPRNEKGEIDYNIITDPAVYWAALRSEFGGYAPVILDDIIAEAQNQLKEAQTTEGVIEKARATKQATDKLDFLNKVKAEIEKNEKNIENKKKIMKRAFMSKIQVLAIILCFVITFNIVYKNKTTVTIREKTMTEWEWREYLKDDPTILTYETIKKSYPFGLPDWFDYMFYFAYFAIASCAVIVVTNNFRNKK
jgi:hypothetical protein